MRANEEIIKDIKSVLDKNVKDNGAMHGGRGARGREGVVIVYEYYG